MSVYTPDNLFVLLFEPRKASWGCCVLRDHPYRIATFLKINTLVDTFLRINWKRAAWMLQLWTPRVDV